MATVWLVTNGGSGGQYGDDWLVDTIHTTQASAAARAAGERWFDEVEEWQIHGSLLTDSEREAIEVCAQAASNCGGFGNGPAIYQGDQIAATLRGLLERTNDPTAVM